LTIQARRFDSRGPDEGWDMSEDVGLVAVVAHRTLNDLAAIQGLLTTARRLTVDDPVRAEHLLDLAEQRISESLDTFRALTHATGTEATVVGEP